MATRLPEPREPTFYFVGVSTRRSSIRTVFPAWAEAWGIEARLEGVDLPIGAPDEGYREVVRQLRERPLARGALVTTHKLDLYRAARDLFDALDPWAERCAEVSCISKRDGSLVGHAKDPISSDLALRHFVPGGHWRSGAEVLCLGAGGAAAAISLVLAEAADGPGRITVVDIDPARLEHLRGLHATLRAGTAFRYLRHDGSRDNDALLAALPPGSLVINATGMGKDRPGSPLSDAAVFPERGLVWELNYRGSLEFLRQAERQAAARGLHVEDGWVYFLHGWTQVIAEVFDRELTPELFARLDAIATGQRDRGAGGV